jgi:hypothetical protein
MAHRGLPLAMMRRCLSRLVVLRLIAICRGASCVAAVVVVRLSLVV